MLLQRMLYVQANLDMLIREVVYKNKIATSFEHEGKWKNLKIVHAPEILHLCLALDRIKTLKTLHLIAQGAPVRESINAMACIYFLHDELNYGAFVYKERPENYDQKIKGRNVSTREMHLNNLPELK